MDGGAVVSNSADFHIKWDGDFWVLVRESGFPMEGCFSSCAAAQIVAVRRARSEGVEVVLHSFLGTVVERWKPQ